MKDELKADTDVTFSGFSSVLGGFHENQYSRREPLRLLENRVAGGAV